MKKDKFYIAAIIIWITILFIVENINNSNNSIIYINRENCNVEIDDSGFIYCPECGNFIGKEAER